MSAEATTTTELVGYLGIDTGRLVIADPCYLCDAVERASEHGDVSVRNAYEAAKPGKPTGEGIAFEENPDYLAGVLRTFGGDGAFPVYVTRDADGRALRVEVEFYEAAGT
jgi:hypothetical protein